MQEEMNHFKGKAIRGLELKPASRMQNQITLRGLTCTLFLTLCCARFHSYTNFIEYEQVPNNALAVQYNSVDTEGKQARQNYYLQ